MSYYGEFFLVWNPSTGRTQYKHGSLGQARSEAERLARENPGQVFHVLANMGCARKTDVEWIPSDDGVPF